MKSIKDILFTIILAVCLILFIKSFVLDFRVVASESMTPTLEKGDIILISKLAYNIFGIDYRNPEFRDIVTFDHDNELLIKRVKDVSSEGDLFLVGDNIDNSLDSRDFGYIRKDSLDGKAIIRVNFRTFRAAFLDD